MELSDNKWMDDAACKDSSMDVFFNHLLMDLGVAICMECRVKQTCLDWRLDTVDPWERDYGVWGATKPAERNIMRLKRDEKSNGKKTKG